MTADKPTYRRWTEVPETLKTKTQLRQAGLRPARSQAPVATFDSPYGDWKLYDISQAVPRKPASPELAARLAAAREKVDRLRTCRHCGEMLSLDEYGDWKRRRIRTGLRERGEDISGAEHQYICDGCKARRRASDWAQAVLTDPGAVILDTETTGLDETAEIIEIAIIKAATGETLFESLVKPWGPMGATHIHGITAEDVAQAPNWPEVEPRVRWFTQNASRTIVYNVAYDWRLVQQTAAYYGTVVNDDTWPGPWECAMHWYAQWYGQMGREGYRWQKLTGGGHRAAGDCLACLEYIKRMAENA